MIYIPDNLLDYFLLEDISWKVVQNVLEWTCGVAHSTAQMVAKARSINPNIQIACTRKSIPGTRLLSTAAILDGGAIIHRAGTAETILFFANHRRCLPQPFDWTKHIDQLRYSAPDKKIIAEAGTIDEAEMIMSSHADVAQLDKFTPTDIAAVLQLAKIVERAYDVHLSYFGSPLELRT